MSKNNHHGGKSGRDDHDDYGSGHKGKFQLLVGTNGNEVLAGGSRNDLIIALAGDDKLLGGAGNDILIGDGGIGGKHWGWNQCHWWKPKGQGDDYLDGGAGNDLVLAGKGDDVANYTLSENSRAHDVYDGGKGFDTLQLTLTHAELQLASVQKDIAAFEAFLACKADPHSDSGRTFHFQSFDLDARNFEDLKIVLLNAPPVAKNDAYTLDEDTALVVLGPGILGNDSDLEGSPLSVALVTGPAHGTLALGADGSFTYTPNLNFNGTDAFSYKVNDGDLDSNIAAVTLQVAPENDAPVADDEVYSVHAGQTLSVPAAQGLLIGDTDADSDPLSVTQANVTGLQGSLAPSANGSFQFTPTSGFSGTTSFTYTVGDGFGGFDQGSVTINVTNEAPVADDEHYTMRPGQTLSVPAAQGLLIGDTDADSDPLSVTQANVTGLQGSLAPSADGSFQFTPTSGFSGTTSFTYTVGDGLGGIDTATVSIDVVNSVPVADDEVYSVHAGQTLSVPAAQGLLIGDTDADSDPLSVTQANVTGLQGSLAPSANGSFQFTPTSGFSGTTSFTYTVGDGFGGFDQGSVTINVTNEAPVADDEHYTMRPGQTLSVPAAQGLLIGDTDADSDPLSVTQANVTGLQGSLAPSADGSFQFTPTSGFSGTTSFTYTVGDGLGGIDTATVSIDVVNSVPVADDEVYSVHAGQTLSVPAAQGLLIGDTDADSDPLSVTQANVTGLQGSLAPSANGSFQFTPTSGFSGTTSFTYTVGDGFGGFDQGSVTINVTNEAPVADDEHYTMRPGQTLSVPAAQGLLIGDTDADSDPLSVTQANVTGLQGSLAPSADGSFQFTPTSGFSGTTSFTYTVGDGLGGIDTATVSIDVVNSVPVADDEVYSVHAGQTLSVPAAQGLLIGDTDADSDPLSVTQANVTGLQGSLAPSANGSFQFTPTSGFSGTTSFTYTVGDGFGGFDQGSVTINVTNEAPVATDDTIGGSGGGAIRVAVIGGSASTYLAAAAQLNDEVNPAFDLDAVAIDIAAWTTEAQWTAVLANYDVVVLGGSGGGNDYGDSPVFAALGDFVDAGGGVVTTGWYMQALAGMSTPTLADADYITPVAGSEYAFAKNLSTIAIADAAHPIAGGMGSYTVQALFHELAPATDGSATVLATGTATTNDTLTAIAYDEVGAGLTVYLGSLHFASADYSPDLIRSGDADLIFERAVAWAAGAPHSGAATDEDTILPIDVAQLLANDTDVDGDALSIASVAATSTLGASVTIDDATGKVVYDPTVALQYLSAGEIKTDTFEYTISDGNGGFDTAKVSLTVAGVYDAPDAAIEAFSHTVAPDVDLF